ncbi:MAG TPA: hypothetical protein VF287_06635 [Usitatibacter sp.]
MSWTESWDVGRYVANYLRERAAPSDRNLHAAVVRLIFRYPGDPPYTKANMDYYLDANFGRELSAPRAALPSRSLTREDSNA